MLRWKMLLFALAISPALAIAQDAPKSCVIVNRHPPSWADNIHGPRKPKPFDYVEGEFPKGMKFHANIDDKIVQDIKGQGGKLIVMPTDYKLPDLQDARSQCSAFIASSPQTAPASAPSPAPASAAARR